MSRCPKHVPKPAVTGDTTERGIVIALGRWRDVVRCESCGMFGQKSHGRTRSGLPRILWFRQEGATEHYDYDLARYRVAIGLTS